MLLYINQQKEMFIVDLEKYDPKCLLQIVGPATIDD